MRIAQLVNNLDMGGLERLAVDLALCQVADGHDAFIYCLTHPGRLANEAAALGITVRSFGKTAGPQLTTVWKIARQLRDDRISVLHMHNHLVNHYGVVASLLVPGSSRRQYAASRRTASGVRTWWLEKLQRTLQTGNQTRSSAPRCLGWAQWFLSQKPLASFSSSTAEFRHPRLGSS